MPDIILAINLAVTLSIGAVTFLIIHYSTRDIEDDIIKEYAQRLRFVILVLLLFVVYWGLYRYSLQGSSIARYPLYLALIFVFLYLMWSVMSFEKLADQHGTSTESKMDKITKQELGEN
ncbi:MAG: hypothetical protein ABEK01_05215 [Candidatus Nanohaloarchaea archaeon]